LLEAPRFYKYLEGPSAIDGVDNASEFKDTVVCPTSPPFFFFAYTNGIFLLGGHANDRFH